MRKEQLYIAIGMFVFGAFMLTMFGAFFVYNQYFYGKIETYVMLFKGSLTGLDATSAITYRGVKIGEVKRIELTATKSKSNVSIPVYVEFFVEKSFVQRDNPIQILIASGVVATITAPNILTGTASIELIPSEIKQPSYKFKTFHGYSLFPTETSPESTSTTNDTLKTARKTLNDISEFIRSKELKDTIVSIKAMSDSIKLMAENVDKVSNTLALQMPGVLVYFNDSLQQISKAAYSTRNLTDYLSRHPESLLRGK